MSPAMDDGMSWLMTQWCLVLYSDSQSHTRTSFSPSYDNKSKEPHGLNTTKQSPLHSHHYILPTTDISIQRDSYTLQPFVADPPLAITGRGRVQVNITLLPVSMLYSHDLLFSRRLWTVLCRCQAWQATLGSHLVTVQHVYGSLGLLLRRFIAVADRHEASLHAEWGQSFPVRSSMAGSRAVLQRHRFGKLPAGKPVGYVWVQSGSWQLRLGRGCQEAGEPVGQMHDVLDRTSERKIGRQPIQRLDTILHANILDSLPLIRVCRLLLVSYYPPLEVLAVRFSSEPLSLTADE
ncbi:hypothetical protein QBC45DRAFT_59786 [Copromyces sp. CBS 386.78]|nr:hypothetical protein QBC45DRAFT_59786 [Copromyces sp. CBS 386.78]